MGEFEQINDVFRTVFLKGHFHYCEEKDYKGQRTEARRPVRLFVTTHQG